MGWREFNDSKVGDKITINRYGGAGHRQTPYEFRTIARVLKNGIVDNTGDRWTQTGDRWGRSSLYTGIMARKFKDSDETDNKELIRDTNHRNWRAECKDADWSRVPIENVKLIRAILRWKGPHALKFEAKVVPNP